MKILIAAISALRRIQSMSIKEKLSSNKYLIILYSIYYRYGGQLS